MPNSIVMVCLFWHTITLHEKTTLTPGSLEAYLVENK